MTESQLKNVKAPKWTDDEMAALIVPDATRKSISVMYDTGSFRGRTKHAVMQRFDKLHNKTRRKPVNRNNGANNHPRQLLFCPHCGTDLIRTELALQAAANIK